MKVYHQTGHNWKWNLESYKDDSVGDGLILSPVNIEAGKVQALPIQVRKCCFFDPQTYLPKDTKGKLASYDYFPNNIKNGFQTEDFDELAAKLAQKCIDFQATNEFSSIIIPTRHFDELPSDYLQNLTASFVEPFLNYYEHGGLKTPLILTAIVKPIQLTDEEQKSNLLNWITGISQLTGVYLILENNFTSKQIKDASYLAKALEFIHILKLNNLDVHLGYTDTEAFLYSIADPNSVSIGVYENLRSFGITRFKNIEKGQMRGPNPRIYSGALFQWIDYGYLGAIQKLYSKWENLFEETKYKPLMFAPTFQWHFQKPELYKHYFSVFVNQIAKLPTNISTRTEHVASFIKDARATFNELTDSGIFLDSDSDGSHLSFWLTAISLYKKYLAEAGI